MTKYLLDTNAYFEILKHLTGEIHNPGIEPIIHSECYISKLTKIEIISVIGKYSRGQSRQIQICDRIHEDTLSKCQKRFVVGEKRKWTPRKLRDWIKLEKEITSGLNPRFNIQVLEINDSVIKEAQHFIENALKHNFGSMDAMILGTAKAYSATDPMVVVTADKGLKAGMKKIGFPFISLI